MPDPIIIEDDGSHYPITPAGRLNGEINRVTPGEAPLAIVCLGANNLGDFDPAEPYVYTFAAMLKVDLYIGDTHTVVNTNCTSLHIEFTKKKRTERIHVALIQEAQNAYTYYFSTSVPFDEAKNEVGNSVYVTTGLFNNKDCKIASIRLNGMPYTPAANEGVQVHIS